MTAKYLINPFEEAERLAEDRGNWVVATVDSRISWPTRKQVVTYDGKDFLLFPDSSDADRSAGVALRADAYGLDSQEARREIMRFCSALSWSEGSGIEILTWGGGNLPRPIHVRLGRMVTDYLPAEHLPTPNSDRDKSVLALYREGTSLDNPFYAFLSLYKVISVVFPDGKERGEWISNAVDSLDEMRAKERRDKLLDEGADIGRYIRDEGRNAIAHAEQEPYVNPDEVDDHFRLQQDIPLLRNLAELAIEQQTGMRRAHTIWRDHLYELEGFKALMPQGILELLIDSQPIPDGAEVELPDRYTVLARRGAEVYAFEDMRVKSAGQVKGGMVLDFLTSDESACIRVVLNFADERLLFDPMESIGLKVNRESDAQIRTEMRMLRFQRCILSNGHLEVWDAENESILGRSETCIPVNCMVNHEFYEKEISALQALLDNESDTSKT